MKCFAVLVILAVLFALSEPAETKTWYVPSQCPTIQAGIDSASAGDTVLVAGGTYYEHDLEVRSLCLLSETGDADCVTIDVLQQGKGIYSSAPAGSTTTVHGFTITNASAGGVSCFDLGSHIITNCALVNNSGQGAGGLSCSVCSVTVYSSVFFENYAIEHEEAYPAPGGGGAIEGWYSTIQLIGCIFSGNGSDQYNTSIFVKTALATLIQCTIDDNGLVAWGSHGGYGGHITLQNSILLASTMTGPYSDILQSCCFSDDPLFCDRWNRDYHLRSCSPCLDFPDCGLIGALGAGNCALVWHVPNEVLTIQAGIDLACAGDTVLVACGTYHDCTHEDNWGALSCVIMKSGVSLRSETGEPSCVTIDAQGLGRGIFCADVDSTTRIEGITITNADVSSAPYPGYCGGGMTCRLSSPTVTNCTFSENAAWDGGGVYCSTGSPSIVNCTFYGNSASTRGGGLDCDYGSHPTVRACTFSDNSGYTGGGVGCYQSSPTLDNTIIAFSTQGEGVNCEDQSSTPSLTCCDVYGNAAGDWVGYIADQYGVSGNLSLDPLFCEPDSGDYHLAQYSPCADAPGCELIGAWPVGCEGSVGILCFNPQVIDSTFNCLTGEIVEVDITLQENPLPLGTIAFSVTYESSFFRFLGCSNGDLTSSWPPIGCATTRGEDTVEVYGNRGIVDAIPVDASGSLVRLAFEMDCSGMVYGDSMPSLLCITDPAYDCSTFVSCDCRNWILTDVVENEVEVPWRLSLGDNYPNPFYPSTTIEYDLPAPGGRVNLAVYDVRGRLVRTLVDQNVDAGHHRVYWDGKNNVGDPVPSGIYFHRLETPQGVEQRKAIVLK